MKHELAGRRLNQGPFQRNVQQGFITSTQLPELTFSILASEVPPLLKEAEGQNETSILGLKQVKTVRGNWQFFQFFSSSVFISF